MARWRCAASRLAPAVCAALLLVSVIFVSRLAHAAEHVGIDAGLHPGYARIVFDWPGKVGFEAKIEGETLRVHFTRPLSGDLAVVARRIDTYVAKIAMAGETDVVATLRRPVELHSFALGDKVAIDLVDKPAPSKSPPPGPAPIEPKEHSETKPPVAAKLHAKAEKVTAPAAAPPVKLLPAAAATPPVSAASPAPPPVAAPVVAESPPDASPGLAAPPDEPAPLPPRVAIGDDGATLRFDLPRRVPMATFRQGPALWIVFGAPVPVDLAALRAQAPGLLRSIERIPNKAATILRLVTPSGFNPSPRRAGSGWVVELRRQLLQPDTPIGVSIQPAAQPPRIILGVREPGTPIAFRDPELGESLIVVPVNQVGLGVVREQKLVDATILLTAQGIALRPQTDGVMATALPHGIAVTAAGGLILSGERDRALRGGTTPHRLFDFKDWFGPPDADILAHRRALEQNIVAAAPAARSNARLDLAHFYLARALAPEAIGVLDAIRRDDPSFAADPRVRAVTGAALLLTGRVKQAAQELELPALDGEPEIAIWRGALDAARHDEKDAADQFAKGTAVLRSYPPLLRHRLALTAAKAALAEGQQDEARRYLALVKDHPNPHQAAEVQLLTARALQLSGEREAGRVILDKLANGDDRETRARARLTRTLADFDSGTITRPAAIRRLDALRFAWRGDDVELTVLRRLGELEIKDGRYRAGFTALHEALEHFPDYPEHRLIEQELARDFDDIFIGRDAENVPPLKALALYDEFKQQLMPSGAKGDEIIRRLADRLVAMDLLGQAGDLLENQVKNRLAGRDKARVAARLALVRLLDRKPKEALAALDIDVGSDIGTNLLRQRHQLRARALSELGRSDEALKVLADDRSRDADRLRADIAWRTHDWAAAAKVLERLAVAPGADGTLSAEDARIVLDWATALTLAGDQAGVARLAATYAKAMDASPFREPFRVVAGDPEKEKGDMRQLVGEVAQLDDLQSFMAGYRKTLSTKSLSAIN